MGTCTKNCEFKGDCDPSGNFKVTLLKKIKKKIHKIKYILNVKKKSLLRGSKGRALRKGASVPFMYILTMVK